MALAILCHLSWPGLVKRLGDKSCDMSCFGSGRQWARGAVASLITLRLLLTDALFFEKIWKWCDDIGWYWWRKWVFSFGLRKVLISLSPPSALAKLRGPAFLGADTLAQSSMTNQIFGTRCTLAVVIGVAIETCVCLTTHVLWRRLVFRFLIWQPWVIRFMALPSRCRRSVPPNENDLRSVAIKIEDGLGFL